MSILMCTQKMPDASSIYRTEPETKNKKKRTKNKKCTTSGHPRPFPKLHPSTCSSVGMLQGTDAQTQTHRHTHRRAAPIYSWLCQMAFGAESLVKMSLVNVGVKKQHLSLISRLGDIVLPTVVRQMFCGHQVTLQTALNAVKYR